MIDESKFLCPLDVEELRANTWKLLHPLLYTSKIAQTTIVIPSEFVSDMYSSPEYLPLSRSLVDFVSQRPAIVHDFMYDRQLFARKVCDEILKEAMIADGCPAWKAWLVYLGVRLGGGSHFK